MICEYCGGKAILRDGGFIGKLDTEKWWVCENYPECNAYVGTHKNSKYHIPKGSLANKGLRYARIIVHKEFDSLWQKYGMTRDEAYRSLAGYMRLKGSNCHIGMFNIAQCQDALICINTLKKG